MIEKGLSSLNGVTALRPDYFNRRLYVEMDTQVLDASRIVTRLKSLGFAAQRGIPTASGVARLTWGQTLPPLIGGGLLAVAALTWAVQGTTTTTVAALTIASTVASGMRVARAGLQAVRNRSADMNALMTIAAVGALFLGEYFEAATAMFLFGVALWLERYSMNRAHRAVESLVSLTPLVAHRMEGREVQDVDPRALCEGDQIVIRPGERVPCDGQILRGTTSVNQAPLTGESMPVEKSPGESVYAGSLNEEGSIDVCVTETADESLLAHVARLVTEAQASRSPTQRFVDRFAQWYTPTVIALAVVVALIPTLAILAGFLPVAGGVSEAVTIWVHRGLVLLVVACPCALVISTPVTIVCGLHRAAQDGILIKGGEHLENAARIDCIALDKTGTLTMGHPRVREVIPLGPDAPEADELLRIAASLEHHSEHPLAMAIVRSAEQRGLALGPVQQFESLRGFGVAGRIGDVLYRVGSAAMFADEIGVATSTPPDEKLVDQQHQLDGAQPVSLERTLDGPESPARQSSPDGPASHTEGGLPDALEEARQAMTQVLVMGPGAVFGKILLSDPIRSDAFKALEQLHALGVGPLVMLTGDHAAVARSVAEELPLDEVHAQLLPQQKIEQVMRLVARYPNLAMVGDGVNDAPAMAAARIGIALGSRSSDTALETADVVVMAARLTRLGRLVQLGRRCRRRLRQNIAIALGLKALVMLLVLLDMANMWMAVGADVGASMIVVFNGMRMLNEADDADLEHA